MAPHQSILDGSYPERGMGSRKTIAGGELFVFQNPQLFTIKILDKIIIMENTNQKQNLEIRKLVSFYRAVQEENFNILEENEIKDFELLISSFGNCVEVPKIIKLKQTIQKTLSDKESIQQHLSLFDL